MHGALPKATIIDLNVERTTVARNDEKSHLGLKISPELRNPQFSGWVELHLVPWPNGSGMLGALERQTAVHILGTEVIPSKLWPDMEPPVQHEEHYKCTECQALADVRFLAALEDVPRASIRFGDHTEIASTT